MDLFGGSSRPPDAPLADRLRPETFGTFVGHAEAVKTLRQLARSPRPLPSIIFWGPPGCGKTTLARLVARETRHTFVPFSAVTSGIKEVRGVIQNARNRPVGTILFVDEIHRFNRAQQDAFLPAVENGTIILIGATTENPSFEINAPLLSRCRVFRLEALTDADLRRILDQALKEFDEVHPKPDALEAILGLAGGDARAALNLLEISASLNPEPDAETVRRAAQERTVSYDRNREEHYNVISAFIKSMRGSDPDAALHWLARMLEAGEDPLFVARRIVIFASEDVGNADPAALPLAVAVMQAVHSIGMPEAVIPLAHATTYLAGAPKSNASYTAYLSAKKDVREQRHDPVPLHLRNAVTGLMKQRGYGKGYQVPHDHPGAVVDQTFLPPNLQGRRYYQPKPVGAEARIRQTLEAIRRARTRPPPTSGPPGERSG